MEMEKKKEPILEIPTINRAIIEAVNSDSLVIFAGAGVSALLGLPLWSEMATILLKECEKIGYIDNQTFDLLDSKINDAKQKITISYELFKENDNTSHFFECFRNSLKPKDELSKAKNDIFKFCKESNALVITTNADTLMDSEFDSACIFSDIKAADYWPRRGPALVKIHGTQNDEESLVFTTSQYLKRYNNKGFSKYLREIFTSGKTILFIGYGLNEFELLDYLLETTEYTPNERDGKVIVLNPYYSYEYEYMKSMKLYYESINVQQIPYCKDKKGFTQLAEVLSCWWEIIEKTTALKEIRLKKLKEAISQKDVGAVLQITKNNQEANAYFASRVRTITEKTEWLNLLWKTDYFCADIQIKSAEDKTDDNGQTIYYSQPWYGLNMIRDILEMSTELANDLLSKVEDILDTAIDCILNDSKRCTNYSITHSLCSSIPLLKSNCFGDKLYDYLLLVSNHSRRGLDIFIHTLTEKKSRICEWNENERIKVMSTLMSHYCSKDDDIDDYYIEQLIDYYRKQITSNHPEKSIKLLDDTIDIIENSRQFAFAEVGAISYSVESETLSNGIKKILECITYLINYAVSAAEYIIKKSAEVENERALVNKLGMYAIASHYSDLKHHLFIRENNPFDDWNLYGDLFYVIEKNNTIITSEECNKLIIWIQNSNMGEESNDDYCKVKKYDLLKLLAQNHKEAETEYGKYYVKEHNEYPEVKNRSRLIRTWTKVGPNFEPIFDKIKNSSFDEVGIFLKSANTKGEFDLYDYSYAFERKFAKMDVSGYEPEHICNTIPYDYYSSMIRLLDERYDNDFIIRLCAETLQRIKGEKEFVSVNKAVFQKLVDLNTTNEESAFACNVLLNALGESKDKYLNSIVEANENNEIIFAAINDWFCEGIGAVLNQAIRNHNFEVRRKVYSFVDEIICLPNEKSGLTKVMIALCLNSLLQIDKEKTYENIERLASDTNSIIAILFRNRFDKKLYLAIKKKANILELYNYEIKYRNNVLDNLACWSIHASITERMGLDEVFREILDKTGTESLMSVFSYISNIIEKDNEETPYAKIIIKQICEYIFSNVIINKDTCQVIRYLCKCINMCKGNVIDEIIWKCLEKLATGFESYINEEVTKCFLNRFDEYPEEIANITTEMVLHSNEWAFHNEKEFDEVIKKIRDKDNLDREYYNKINSELIKRNIFRFTEE